MSNHRQATSEPHVSMLSKRSSPNHSHNSPNPTQPGIPNKLDPFDYQTYRFPKFDLGLNPNH